MRSKLACLTILIALARLSFSQGVESRELLYISVDSLRQFNISSSNHLFKLKSTLLERESIIVNTLSWKFTWLKTGKLEGFPKEGIKTFESDTTIEAATYNLYYGDFLKESGVDDTLAYKHYYLASEISKNLNDSIIICESLKRMVKLVNDSRKNFPLLDALSVQYLSYAYDDFEKDMALLYRTRAISMMNKQPYIEDFLEVKQRAKLHHNIPVLAYCLKLLGVKHDVYATRMKDKKPDENLEQAINYYDGSLELYKKYRPSYFERMKRIGIYIDKAIAFDFLGHYDSAAKYYQSAHNLTPDNDYENNVLYHLWVAKHLFLKKDFDSAYYHKDMEVKLRREYNTKRFEASIAEINTRYETEKRERENLQLKADNERAKRIQRNWVIGSITLLLISGMVGFLLRQNAVKKQQLAEQQKEIESQKVVALLKEQELIGIDAMVAGQEKERLKVAAELHDDLGSLMATIKLHIDNTIKNKQNNSIESARKLLDEAYSKIRNISHLKDSGVYSQEGLLPAIRKMAYDISITNSLKFEVLDFGMDHRMNNFLELTVFRVVQELTTNILKHANANHVLIQLTQHNDSFNLLVEDNGKGFEFEKTRFSNNGIGLRSIEKRIEHLGGSLVVDSVMNRGTTVIIDIPI